MGPNNAERQVVLPQQKRKINISVSVLTTIDILCTNSHRLGSN